MFNAFNLGFSTTTKKTASVDVQMRVKQMKREKYIKKGQKRRRWQWTEHLYDDLVGIILDIDKYKEKLLLTNAKNVKNGQYYRKVIGELKERCGERGEKFPFNVAKILQKFKRCINICRDAVMKVKTSSGIKHFQEDKELGIWFGKLLPIISSMDNWQLQ